MPAEGAAVGQRTVVVVAGGEPVPAAAVDRAKGATVVAADSGIDHALAAGWHVDVAIGDFDSATEAGLERVAREGARVERHPAAKDHTDLELALEEAARLGATDVLVVGIGGGRLDHLLANFLVLATPALAGATVTAFAGDARVHVVHAGRSCTLDAPPGAVVTLLPVGGGATDITTEGLRYPLDREALAPVTSRGVSNVVEVAPCRVTLGAGTLLAILPGADGA
jgi:thiamine pyrophosphokinase